MPECSSRPVFDPSSPIIDLLWREDKSHFHSLSLQPLQPASSQPASSPSMAVTAVQGAGTVKDAASPLLQNLSYRLLFSPQVAWRRNAARLLKANFKDSEFLTNILLLALRDTDSVVFQLVDKMLEKLRFDRYKQEKPISFLITYVDFSIDRDQQRIVSHNVAQGMSINLDQLHKPHPGYADEGPQLSDSPLPSLHDYSPYIARTIRQEGENGVTLTSGFIQGGLQISVGGRTSGAFDNPAGNVPRQSTVSATAQPPAENNPSETRAKNFISYITSYLNEITPDNKKKFGTIATILWPKVQKDPVSIKQAKELYAGLPSELKQKLKDLYPAIHSDLITINP